jgi:hypothetical protein
MSENNLELGINNYELKRKNNFMNFYLYELYELLTEL